MHYRESSPKGVSTKGKLVLKAVAQKKKKMHVLMRNPKENTRKHSNLGKPLDNTGHKKSQA